MVHNMFPFLRKIYMFEGCVPLLPSTFYWIESIGGRETPSETHGHSEKNLVTFVLKQS